MAIFWRPAAPTRQPRLWRLNGTLVHVLPQRGHILGLTFSRGTGRRIRQHEPGRNRRCLDGRHRRARAAADRRDRVQRTPRRSRPTEASMRWPSPIATPRIYDGTDGRVLAPLAGHGSSVTSIAFDAAGKTIATGSDDGTIRLWYPNYRVIGSPRREARNPARTGSRASPPRTAASSPRAKAGNAYLRDAKTGRARCTCSQDTGLWSPTSEFSERQPSARHRQPGSRRARLGRRHRAVGARAARALLPGLCGLRSARTGNGSSPPANSPPGSGTRKTGQLVEYLRGAVRPLSNVALSRRQHDRRPG